MERKKSKANKFDPSSSSLLVLHNFKPETLVHEKCKVCRDYIYIFGEKCAVCGCKAHPKCVPNVKSTCRPLTNLYVWYHNHKRTNENVDDSRESLVLETSVQLVPGVTNKCHFVAAFFTHNEKEMVATNDVGDSFLVKFSNGAEATSSVPYPLDSKKIKYVSAGGSHTLFLTSNFIGRVKLIYVGNGHVYVYGRNIEGQLGLGSDVKEESTPTIVTGLLGKVVSRISAGSKHSMVATTNNELYTWGLGKNGRLGTGKTDNEYSPVQITLPNIQSTKTIITNVICGWSHSICVINNYFLFTWGKGINGGLGHGIEVDELSPRLVDFNHSIVDVAAGYLHTMVLTGEGKVYCFGTNKEGECALSESNPSCLVPTLVNQLNKESILSITCGQFHNIAITTTGTVYLWGSVGNIQHPAPTILRELSSLSLVSVKSGFLETVVLAESGADTKTSKIVFNDSMIQMTSRPEEHKESARKGIPDDSRYGEITIASILPGSR